MWSNDPVIEDFASCFCKLRNEIRNEGGILRILFHFLAKSETYSAICGTVLAHIRMGFNSDVLYRRVAAEVAAAAVAAEVAHPLATLLRKAPRVARRGT